MYKIIFSINNNEEVWVLPHCPPDFPIPQPEQHHETYEGLSRDYRRIGTLGLRHMEWTALFPVHRYSFMPPVRWISMCLAPPLLDYGGLPGRFRR